MLSAPMLNTIGVLTGIVTGVASLVLGCINHRRLQQIKSLDLRLEFRKQVSDVRAVSDALPDLLERSRQSRIAVLAAIGLAQSGASESWMDAWKIDFQAAQELAREVPESNETYQRSRYQDLEPKLVEIHALAAKAARLRDKYLDALASDDKEREHIRADVRARVNADRC